MFQGMEYIYEVYKERSFSRAARNLYISQPSLSATVRRIENRIGSPIFDRSTTPVGLTECGEKYIECVEQILAVQNSFQNYLGDLGGLKTGHLSLGGTHLFSSYVLPSLISRFTKSYPQITINLIEESSSSLELLLQNGTLDLVVDNSHFNETITSRLLYKSEHLLLAVPSSFAINRSLTDYRLPGDHIRRGIHLEDGIPAVPLDRFREEPFVFLKPENDTRHREMALCRKAGFFPHIVLELDQQVTAYNITGSGMGISFISDTLVRSVPPHPHVTYYKLDGPESCREIHFYWKTGKYVSKAMETFLEMARQPG
ncbi:MAG: LysR family transcriptional regulator [Candidatus Limivivens sp.]|nr:LysR family transcriptional regulator [Candidatus Limivivens sp.]